MSLPFWNPTRRLIAERALEQLAGELHTLAPHRIALVLGQASFRRSPHAATLREAVRDYTVYEAPAVPANPTTAFVQAAWEQLRGARCQAVVGVGGGSVLDVAKLLALLLAQDTAALDGLVAGQGGNLQPPLPMIAIPTTAGTGSEVTPFASLQTDDRKKITVEHVGLFPRVALIDPLLTHSMPPYITACTGFDALSQAIEAFWAVRHTPFADTHALRAIPFILEHLERAVLAPNDRAARFAMALASSEAGLAISQTRTTAVHAVSYPLTSFFGIPHGHACALTLASFIRFNAPALVNGRGTELWSAMGVATSEDAAVRAERLMLAVKLERRLSRLGVDTAGREQVVTHGFRADRVKNNPRALDPETLRELLEALQ